MLYILLNKDLKNVLVRMIFLVSVLSVQEMSGCCISLDSLHFLLSPTKITKTTDPIECEYNLCVKIHHVLVIRIIISKKPQNTQI